VRKVKEEIGQIDQISQRKDSRTGKPRKQACKVIWDGFDNEGRS
jgi:hypothetical protein